MVRLGAILAVVGLIMAGASAPSASAQQIVDQNQTPDGLGVKGYDPVAYFASGTPTPGLSRHTYEYQGVTYRFANADNRQTFIAYPQRYLPAYGRFCAYGVRTGRKLDIDPNAWRIVEDRLYLLLNPGTQAVWELQRNSNIRIADAIWPKIRPFTDQELLKQTP